MSIDAKERGANDGSYCLPMDSGGQGDGFQPPETPCPHGTSLLADG